MNQVSYNTPTQLLEHGVAANLGTAMLPRGYMSCKDPEIKPYLLRTAWVLHASKAVPRPGDEPKKTDAASQLMLGLMQGQDRSTTNRDLRMFCGVDAQIKQFFNKWRPGIGVVNHYSARTEEQEPQPGKKEALLYYDAEKLAARHGDQYFDAAMEGVSGSGPVALWTYDPNVPKPVRCGCRKGQMTMNFSSQCGKCGGKGYTFHRKKKMGANARTVLTTLQLKGIADPELNGYLEISSEDLGKLCGLCENTVADALDQWEDLKVLQITPGKVFYEPGTNAVKYRKPQRIIWLPGLLLDPAMIERERQRFAQHLAETRQLALLNGWAAAGVHLDRIKALHQEMLLRWCMSRHSLGAFWNAMRKLIYREGIPCGRSTGDHVDYRACLFPISLYDSLE